MKKKKKSRIRLFFLLTLVFASVLFSGCERKTFAETEKEKELILKKPEIMLIVATERNRYEEIYTDQIWNVQVSESGTTFQEHLLEQIRQFIIDVKQICVMAEDYGISLDNSEKEQLRRLSEDYYGKLTDGDKSYTGAEFNDVLSLYQQYYLANKAVTKITENADLEISDNEAKVITVMQIVLDEEEKAEEVYRLVTAENANFSSIAKANSVESEIEKKMGRGEEKSQVEETAFSLKQGEISPIIEENGKYYILFCKNDYEQEATLQRKKDMLLLRKDWAFRQSYDEFLAETTILTDSSIWQDICCVTDEPTTTTNFFELYREYFP